MWRLLRDQVERSWRQIPVLAAVAAAAALLASSLGPLRVQPAGDPGRLFARLFIATFPVFAAASFGLLSTLTNSRYRPAAVVRILPVRRDQLARALALGAGMPGLIIGALVSALVILLHIGLGLGGFDRTLFERLAPTALACMLGSAMSVVWSCHLAATGGLTKTTRLLTGLLGYLIFPLLWYFAWLRVATRLGPLAVESLLIVSTAVGAAGSCVLLSPRLHATFGLLRSAPPASSRDVRVSLSRPAGRNASLIPLSFRGSTFAFGSALLVNLGFLTAIAVRPPLDQFFSYPFRLRWMVLTTYAVVWFWFVSWRSGLRTLRCLPISGGKLVLASIGSCSLIYLAGSIAVVAALAFEPGQARVAFAELPFIVLLAFGTSLCLAGIGMHTQRPKGLLFLGSLGFVLLPNAMFLPIALGDGTWLVGFTTSRPWLWSYSPVAGILLIALGAVAIARGILHSGSPYRSAPVVDRGL
jgi:hypothetical protein